MSSVLGAFPVDSMTLENVKHALGGSWVVAEDGAHALVGADFTLSQLLDFYSGYDPERSVHIGYAGDTPIYQHPDAVYSIHDLIRALIGEIERLRHQTEGDKG